MTSQIPEDIAIQIRRDEGVGHRLLQLACGDWNPAPDSSQQTYETYCQMQWDYFAQGRRRFENYSYEITELFRMIRQDEMIEHMLIQLKELPVRQAGQKPLSEHSCHQMINFAARLITPINIGALPNEVNKRRHLKWTTGTLRALIADHFNETPVLTFERLRLPKTFDAWSVHKIGGIKIRFTDNLADHLLLVDDDAVVLVFHHVSYLKQQDKESMLPAGLADETIKTIALLFPQAQYSGLRRAKRRKRAWLTKLCRSHESEYGCCVDECLSKCGGLPTRERQIEKFRFWRDRLVVLKQAYDETTPSTISQWWHDRRNGPQWFTFWVAGVALVFALLALFFTVVQAVEGALQVYLAYHDSRVEDHGGAGTLLMGRATAEILKHTSIS